LRKSLLPAPASAVSGCRIRRLLSDRCLPQRTQLQDALRNKVDAPPPRLASAGHRRQEKERIRRCWHGSPRYALRPPLDSLAARIEPRDNAPPPRPWCPENRRRRQQPPFSGRFEPTRFSGRQAKIAPGYNTE